MLCREGFNERYSIKAKRENKASVPLVNLFPSFQTGNSDTRYGTAWWVHVKNDALLQRDPVFLQTVFEHTSPWKLLVLKNNYFQERATYGIKGISLRRLSCQFPANSNGSCIWNGIIWEIKLHRVWNILYGQREREVRNKNYLFPFFHH